MYSIIKCNSVMPVENLQPQNKKYHPGFFVLLAIIAVVIFSAYALTVKYNQVRPIDSQLSEDEKQNMINTVRGLEPTTPLSKSEKEAMVKSVGDVKNLKPLTEAEKQALISQFQN